MPMTDPIADMLTAIRNGQQARLAHAETPASNLKKSVLNVLKEEGYIEDYAVVDVRPGVRRLRIALKYFEGKPVIQQIRRVSRPGLRKYAAATNLPRVSNGLGISILSTSKGVVSDHVARRENIGGEVLCNVF